MLGYAEVRIIKNKKRLKKLKTGKFIPLMKGRTLPVKFRIEVGDVVSAGPDPTVVTAMEGAVVLDVPAGAVEDNVTIIVEPVEQPQAPPEMTVISGTAYEFTRMIFFRYGPPTVAG